MSDEVGGGGLSHYSTDVDILLQLCGEPTRCDISVGLGWGEGTVNQRGKTHYQHRKIRHRQEQHLKKLNSNRYYP